MPDARFNILTATGEELHREFRAAPNVSTLTLEAVRNSTQVAMHSHAAEIRNERHRLETERKRLESAREELQQAYFTLTGLWKRTPQADGDSGSCVAEALATKAAVLSGDATPMYAGKSGEELRAMRSPSILAKAETIINGDRQQDYGHPLDDFSKTAARWQTIFADGVVTAERVALAMVDVKISRLLNSPDHMDSVVDGAGYFGCYEKVRTERARRARNASPEIVR